MTPERSGDDLGVSDFELQRRWHTPEGRALAGSVVSCLRRGGKIDELAGLGLHEGFVDARGLAFSDKDSGGDGEPKSALIEARALSLRHIDFSGADLSSVRLFDCSLADIRFDNVQLADLRAWRTSFERVSFAGANLRGAVVGPWLDGKGNTYRGVDFSGADLRGIVCPAATFTDCVFEHTRLDRVDFQSSSFIRCRFVGELRDVIFWDRGFQTGKPDPNPMEDIDLRDATLPWVDFRRLDLDRVWLPGGPEHIVLRPYREILECAAKKIPAGDRAGRALIEHRRKWCGPNQRVGVIHEEQVSESADPTRLRRILEACARETTTRD